MPTKYHVELDDCQERSIQQMINDNHFWPANCPPSSVGQLIKWAITDYIDFYKSYRNNKEGEQ